MGKPMLPEKGLRECDVRLGLSVMAGVAVFNLISAAWAGAGSYLNLCILAICCAFVSDVDWKTSWKSGLTRLMLTGTGALAALIPLFIYDLTQSEVLLTIVVGVVVAIAVVICKFYNVMYVQCRLAAVAFILSTYTFHGAQYAAMGKTGYGFVLMWILSTILGIVISVVVAAIVDLVKGIIKK